MQYQKCSVHQERSDKGLEDANYDSGTAGSTQGGEPKLAADGKGNKAQGHVRNGLKGVHQLKAGKAHPRQAQPANEAGAQQHSGDKVGGDVRQMKALE